MAFTITYHTLLEVRILHHYFLDRGTDLYDLMSDTEKGFMLRGYDIAKFIRITPTAACSKLLAKYKCVFKQAPFGFLIGIQATEVAGKIIPAIQVEDADQFTFTYNIVDPYFNNYTALPLVYPGQQLYFMQNLTLHAPKTFPHLCQYAKKYNAGELYASGDIVADADTPAKLFLAKKFTSNQAPPGTDWINDPLISGKPLQYLNRQDLLPWKARLARIASGENGLNPTVTLKNRAGITLQPNFKIIQENAADTVLIELQNFPADVYELEIDDPAIPYNFKQTFYNLSGTELPSGIIDFTARSNADDYSLIGADGSLRSPVFEIRFKNRYSQWRYLGESFTNKPESGPHPFTAKGVIAVTVKNKDNVNVDDMPNPNIRMVKTEHPAGNEQQYNIVSEIYIN